MFLGAKIIDSFLDGTLSKKSAHYHYWVQRLEQRVFESTQVLTRDEYQARFVDAIEVRHVSTCIGCICLHICYSSRFLKLE